MRTTRGVRCPTCGAPFRGTVLCGRCGADLAARKERELARLAILDGDGDGTLLHVERALALIAANRPLEGVRLASTLVE